MPSDDTYPLGDRLSAIEAAGGVADDDVLASFLGHVEKTGMDLYPAQEEAILELFTGHHVIVTTPTGSGKSMIAVAAAFLACARGHRCALTFPIKALVSEKFFDLCKLLGPERVGMMTGDASVNRDADVVCMTAEVLANQVLAEGDNVGFDVVVMDEFHYYGDKDRGTAWQVPLIASKRLQFLLMSATLGDTTHIATDLAKRTGREVKVVEGKTRPVPLTYLYSEFPLHEQIPKLLHAGKAPIYMVSTSQRDALDEAQNATSLDLTTKEEKRALTEAMVGMEWPSPFGKTLQRYLRQGIGVHHAGLLPRYRLAVEKLAQKGLLKLICGTDTLGVGVNIPIRTVLFTKLCKYDGTTTRVITAREFHQVAGRAGRKGFDVEGLVVAQAPEHAIENLRIDQKIAQDPTKKKKLKKKQPPDRGYAHWDKVIFEKLCSAQPEALVSRFQVNPATLVSMLTRPEGGCLALKQLLRDNHERPRDKAGNKKRALSLFRSLVQTGVFQLVPRSVDARGLLLAADLKDRLSLHQPLSLFLLDAIERLPKETETYALDILSIVESILENPGAIIDRQLDKAKQAKLGELKAQGMGFDERIAELDKMEPVKPLAEFIYPAFDIYKSQHPWIDDNPRPKKIARDIVERIMSFGEYVREYGLERMEGTLLRYLSDVHRALSQTLPSGVMTDEMREVCIVIEACVRGTDASIVEEWERLKDPEYIRAASRGVKVEAPLPPDITRNEKTFMVLVRNEAWRAVRALASQDPVVLGELAGEGVTDGELRSFVADFYKGHEQVYLTPAARNPNLLQVDKTEDPWRVVQTVCDADGATDFAINMMVDLARSRELGRAVVQLVVK